MGATPGATLKTKESDGERWSRRPLHLVVVSNLTDFLVDVGGVDGTRTRGLRRDSRCSNQFRVLALQLHPRLRRSSGGKLSLEVNFRLSR